MPSAGPAQPGRSDAQRPDFSAVVPVYRGVETIDELCRRLEAFFESARASYEIILVDDGSSDGSWERIVEIARRRPRVRGIRLTRNFGQDNAVTCGFRHSRGKLVVTLDEDLQNPPEEIAKLIACRELHDADVVYGIPEQRQDPWWRKLGSRFALLIPRYVMKVDFDISAFRLVRGAIAHEVARAQRHDIIIDVCFAWITGRIAATRVKHLPSTARKSSYTKLKLIQVTLNVFYNYTVVPLRFSMFVGAALSAVSIVLSAYFVYLRITQKIAVPGFTALIVSILFSTGIILIGIGMVSEYLAHTFLHVIRKPQSVIREVTPPPAGDSGP